MKFVVIDWESTALKADQGFLLCGGFKPLGGKPYVIGLRDTGTGKRRRDIDAPLARALRDEVEKYDGIITWNGKMFDIPLLNTRLLLCKERPLWKKPFHIDAMYYARQGQACMTSSRLDWVAKQHEVASSKTSLDLAVWKEAEAEALGRFKFGHENYDYVVDHCEKDLLVTEQVYEQLKPLVSRITR